MTGVIDVGGGLRGAYGAGVFDWCMDNDVHFDSGFLITNHFGFQTILSAVGII